MYSHKKSSRTSKKLNKNKNYLKSHIKKLNCSKQNDSFDVNDTIVLNNNTDRLNYNELTNFNDDADNITIEDA